MEVYEASDDDVEAIRAVAEASWEHDYPDILSRETVEEGFDDWYGPDRLKAALSNPKALVFVAGTEPGGDETTTDSETVSGFVHAIVDGNDGVILRLYVHPDHRKQGLGRALFERAVAELTEYDVERVRAMVLAENTIGNEFYRQLGFEKVSEELTQIGTDYFEENTYEMSSDLPER